MLSGVFFHDCRSREVVAGGGHQRLHQRFTLLPNQFQHICPAGLDADVGQHQDNPPKENGEGQHSPAPDKIAD